MHGSCDQRSCACQERDAGLSLLDRPADGYSALATSQHGSIALGIHEVVCISRGVEARSTVDYAHRQRGPEERLRERAELDHCTISQRMMMTGMDGEVLAILGTLGTTGKLKTTGKLVVTCGVTVCMLTEFRSAVPPSEAALQV